MRQEVQNRVRGKVRKAKRLTPNENKRRSRANGSQPNPKKDLVINQPGSKRLSEKGENRVSRGGRAKGPQEYPPIPRGPFGSPTKDSEENPTSRQSDTSGLISKPRIRFSSEQDTKTAYLRPDCFRILDDKNRADQALDPNLDNDRLLSMYRNMVLTRLFDERGMMLQRQGRIGFYVPSFGQEAIQTGTIAAVDEKDFIFPSYREPGVFLHRGVKLTDLLCNLWGNSGDVCKGRQMPVHYSFKDKLLFSISSPIATQIIQATGAAMAFKIRSESQIALAYFGDGGTSENDFHTGLTFAGAFKAPVVFICTNNQYAISVPVHKQTGAKRLVDKAVGYGMRGVAVDGNDLLAVYSAARDAVRMAKMGEGPTFIECLTLRMGPHSSSDDPGRYRDPVQYEFWKRRDPILRFRQYLEEKHLWSEREEKNLIDVNNRLIAEAIEVVEKQPLPSIETLFSDVFVSKTPQLNSQERALVEEQALRGKFENTSEAFPL